MLVASIKIKSYYRNITTGENKRKIDVFFRRATEEPQVSPLINSIKQNNVCLQSLHCNLITVRGRL